MTSKRAKNNPTIYDAFIDIGSVPCSEPSACRTTKNYLKLAYTEYVTFRQQIIRQFGEPPKGALIARRQIKFTINGEITRLYRLVIYYTNKYPESKQYAKQVDNFTPQYWDSESLKAIDLNTYPIECFD